MSDEIVAWLRKQVDVDESRATAAQAEMSAWGGDWQRLVDDVWKRMVVDFEAVADFIEFNRDPARQLREVAAKRRMLDDILPALTWGDEASAGEWNDYTDHAGDFLKVLASVYADRPGFREEWAA